MSLSKLHRYHTNPPKVEINVVPLVDVSLVLLVIVLLTATFDKNTGFNVKLPKSSMSKQIETKIQDLTVSVTAKGSYVLKNQPISPDALNLELKRYAVANPGGKVSILGDTNAPHGRVVKVMDMVNAARLKIWVGARVENDKPTR
ncbi:MAG: biopolymer transporter ExbD [bacterium]